MFEIICAALNVAQQAGTPRSEELITEGVAYQLTREGDHVEPVNR